MKSPSVRKDKRLKKIIFIRHGESEWNQENKFTGWYDADLSSAGREEARLAGQILKDLGYQFDKAYASVLRRSIKTLWVVLEGLNLEWVEVQKDWRLNERHYGALQGLNKAETAQKYGDAQVLEWRRSYTTEPPLLSEEDSMHPKHDIRYKGIDEKELPQGESMKICLDRVLPCWEERIWLDIKNGKKVVVVAHGNSIRALLKHIQRLSETDVLSLNIPTGTPLEISLDDQGLELESNFLGDQDKIKEAMNKVANQGKK